jgi:hypothetical protein
MTEKLLEKGVKMKQTNKKQKLMAFVWPRLLSCTICTKNNAQTLNILVFVTVNISEI